MNPAAADDDLDPLLHVALRGAPAQQHPMTAHQLDRAFHLRMRGETWKAIATKLALPEKQIAAAVKKYCEVLESHWDDDAQDNVPE